MLVYPYCVSNGIPLCVGVPAIEHVVTGGEVKIVCREGFGSSVMAEGKWPVVESMCTNIEHVSNDTVVVWFTWVIISNIHIYVIASIWNG